MEKHKVKPDSKAFHLVSEPETATCLGPLRLPKGYTSTKSSTPATQNHIYLVSILVLFVHFWE